MQSIREDTVGGFDAFIAEQREQPGECRVTLAQFDDQYELVYADRPIQEVPGLVLQPRGTTALLDAIGRLVTDAGAGLAALPEAERPGTVIVGIMTDGHENASKEWTHACDQGPHPAADRDLRVGVPLHGSRPGRDRGGHGPRRPSCSLSHLLPCVGSVAMASTSAMVGRLRAARASGVSTADIGYSDEEREASAH
jgi:hypothetical protein